MEQRKDAVRAGPRAPHRDAPVYEEGLARDLPGLFWKRVTIQPGEMGLLVEKGQVKGTLRPGQHTVGWRFMDLGPWRRVIGRWRTDPFSMPVRFYRLGDDRDEPLDGFTQATVVIAESTKFHRYGVGGRPRLTSAQLANGAAAAVQVIVDQLAASFEPGALRRDQATQEQLTAKIVPLLEEQLRDRGVRLEKMYPLVFRPSKESEDLLHEALEIEAELATGQDRDWASVRQKVEQFASRALAIELTSTDEVEALRAAADAPGQSPHGVLTGFVQQCLDRMTGQVNDRAQRLTGAKPPPAAGAYGVSLGWVHTLLGWVRLGAVLAAVAAGFVLPLLHGRLELKIDPKVYFGGAYGGLAGIIAATTFALWAVDQWERLRRRQQARAGGVATEQQAVGNLPEVDELTRQQVATELEQGAMADLREAMRLAHAKGKQQDAQEARRLADEARYLAERVRGAEYASTALPSDGKKAVQYGARLVAFEEESLRLARIIARHARETKGRAQDEEALAQGLRHVADGLDALRRHFANRAAVLAGRGEPEGEHRRDRGER